jgi:hypothetical protein
MLALSIAAALASTPREQPDLGVVRFHDPRAPRSIHLGFDFGGVVLPAGFGPIDRTVWMLRGGPGWSIRVAKWLSLGGRHGIALYDAGKARLRAHDHQLEAALHPVVQAGIRSMHDRLAIGVETHALLESRVGGTPFELGGVRDTIVYLGYGMEYRLAGRWTLGWLAHYRHAWVYRDTQRQVRGAMRVAFLPGKGHRVALELTGLFVDRNPDQAGVKLPRRGVYGQVAGEYAWMSKVGVGPFLRARVASGFLGGEAPIFEIRHETLRTPWADVTAGVRATF